MEYEIFHNKHISVPEAGTLALDKITSTASEQTTDVGRWS
jgi:hypothetical protein